MAQVWKTWTRKSLAGSSPASSARCFMRIIFLNTWNGQAGTPLFEFIKKHASSTDIFCLQEVDLPLYEKISKILTGFKGERAEKVYVEPTYFRQATFWKGLKETGRSELFIKEGEPGMGLSTSFEIDGKKLLTCNIHGHVHPGTKVDSDERIKQSEIIINYAKKHSGPVIIGGDFNLDLNTKSVAMFESAGFKNLIKDFGVKSTRNRLSWEQFNNIQHFADFLFVSPEVSIQKFEVPDVEISDHLPMILDFEI